MKQFASVVVIIYIIYRILDALKHPVMRAYRWVKKKTTQFMKTKGPIPKVQQPCVLRLDNNKVDIDKWVNQARMYVEPDIHTVMRKQKSGDALDARRSKREN